MMYMMVACPKCGEMIERHVGFTVEEMRTLERNSNVVLAQDYDEPFTCPHCGKTIDPAKESFNRPDDVVALVD